MLNRALREGDNVLEKKARRAILRQSARERVHVRERAARVLAEKRRVEQTPISRCLLACMVVFVAKTLRAHVFRAIMHGPTGKAEGKNA